jgi:cyclophilin family peptidyl-prolyl cis-trans isomerase
MKTNPFLFAKALILLLALAVSSSLYAQETSDKTANFKWEIRFEKNRILIQCETGCTYQDLAFSSNRTVTLNQSGMLDLARNPTEEGNSQFLITYAKKGNKVTLKGLKWVAWTDLTFTAGKGSYTLDEKGITAHH